MTTQNILDHLQALVSFDTQNPPRAITLGSEIFVYLKEQLPGFEFSMLDAGEGSISLLATRGKPNLLFNFHIDTVPVAPTWTVDPFTLQIDGDKVTALGACDIKGASACMLAAASATKGDVALLFSSDEEHGSSAAVKQFLQTDHGFKQVIVAEPTLAKATLAHRGYQSARVHCSGISGHASEARAIHDSAIHKAGKWIGEALNWAAEQTESFDNLKGLPFNIGKIEGGIKGNMIAADCEMTLNMRPLPGQSSLVMLEELATLAEGVAEVSSNFVGPTLPAANQDFSAAVDNANTLATTCGLPIGPAVSFWTEASLFSEAGLTAIVFGPGDIAQAHTADEWVSLEQLKQVFNHYCQIIEGPQ